MSSGFKSTTVEEFLLLPARLYIGTLASRRMLAIRGGVTATESVTTVLPEVAGVDQEVERLAYKVAHTLTLSFAAVEFNAWLYALINENVAGVGTPTTIYTPPPRNTILPPSSYVNDVRVLGDVQNASVRFFGYHIPKARIVSRTIDTSAASGEATCQVEITAVLPLGANVRTDVPFRREDRADLTF